MSYAAGNSRIQASLEQHIHSGALPGAVALVSFREEVRAFALGRKASTSEQPMQRDSIFRISSMSKPITAAAALLLVDRGVLSLDEPIQRWLPELADRRVLRSLNGPLTDTVRVVRPVTVRDLLSSTDGFGQLYGSPAEYPIIAAALDAGIRMGPPAPASQPEPDEWLNRLGNLPLMQQPGDSFLYDTASDVLSVLTARAAGTDFATFLRENMFQPLGMHDTGFTVPPEQQSRLVSAYTPDAVTGSPVLTDDPQTGQWSTTPAFPSGAGGLVSTCDDYLAFALMLLNDGRAGTQQILKPDTARLMIRDSLSTGQKSRSMEIPLDFRTHTWGLGMAVVTAHDQIWPVGSYGWTGGLGTQWTTDPQRQMIAIVMTQVAMTSPDSGQVFDDFSAAVQAADQS